MKNNIRARPDDPAVVAGARQCEDSVTERRVFISTVAVGLLAARSPIFAQQQAVEVARIGFLGANSASNWAGQVEAFRSGLRDLGYVEGENITIEFR